ncbi:MAG: SDR family oxidoreductase [Dehalococcoidia bacterium]
MGELDGKVAIVTGAGRLRGIGRATAVALAKLGADVVVTGTGRNPASFPDGEKAIGWKDIQGTAEQVRALGRRALPLVVDVTSAEQVELMAEQTVHEFGRIDILVNNAAFARGPDRVPIVELDNDIFRRVVDIKVLGTYLCTKAVARVLLAQGQGGKIVNVASVAGKSGSTNTLAYNAGNFAQVGMTQSMARELGPYGINVNCVCPGWVDTSRLDHLKVEDWFERMALETPIRRNGTDEEVGEFVAYLCTEATSWIHGQSINIDGGGFMEH